MEARWVRFIKALVGWIILSVVFLGVDGMGGGMMGRGGIGWAYWAILGLSLWPIFSLIDALAKRE